MKRFGFLDKVTDYLKEAGMEVKLFEGIEPDPSVDTVMKGAEVMREFQPDWIVAIGGGSPIDATKAMWIKYEYPDVTFEDMCKVFGLPKLRTKAHFCAISSTSGTGTEVTAFAGSGRDHAEETGGSYRYGCNYSFHRGICIHCKLQLHGCAGAPFHQDDPG